MPSLRPFIESILLLQRQFAANVDKGGKRDPKEIESDLRKRYGEEVGGKAIERYSELMAREVHIHSGWSNFWRDIKHKMMETMKFQDSKGKAPDVVRDALRAALRAYNTFLLYEALQHVHRANGIYGRFVEGTVSALENVRADSERRNLVERFVVALAHHIDNADAIVAILATLFAEADQMVRVDKDGRILVKHVRYNDGEYTKRALEQLLRGCEDRAFTLIASTKANISEYAVEGFKTFCKTVNESTLATFSFAGQRSGEMDFADLLERYAKLRRGYLFTVDESTLAKWPTCEIYSRSGPAGERYVPSVSCADTSLQPQTADTAPQQQTADTW